MAATTSSATRRMRAKDEKLVFEIMEGVEPILNFDQMSLKDDLEIGHTTESCDADNQWSRCDCSSQSGTGKTSMVALIMPSRRHH
ncbi:hypothetical protein V6N13_005185 [Hibiscus sabdariffa]|uniref:Uncharacterized protein n=1 Tax=Hibiscus sabdariffa TaxID=183260 RepID=A0ABR2ERG9_9ROSI